MGLIWARGTRLGFEGQVSQPMPLIWVSVVSWIAWKETFFWCCWGNNLRFCSRCTCGTPLKAGDICQKHLSGVSSNPQANRQSKLQVLQSIQYYSHINQLVLEPGKWKRGIEFDLILLGLLADKADLGFPFSKLFQCHSLQWRAHVLETPLLACTKLYFTLVERCAGMAIQLCFACKAIRTQTQILWAESNFLLLQNFLPGKGLTCVRTTHMSYPDNKDVSRSFILGLCWVGVQPQRHYGGFLDKH